MPSGYRLIALDDVDSTNAHAARLAADGEPGPVWICARTQNAGRGRRGRNWVSEPGNLYATLLTCLPVDAATAAQLGFVAALAIHDMATTLKGSREGLRLKWPNDVLLDGKKLSGILSETISDNGQLCVAVGCGINLKHAPQDTRYGATTLASHNVEVEPAEAMTVLAGYFDKWLSVWRQGEGFDAIRTAWVERSYPNGHHLTLMLGERQVSGAFNGLAADGALLLELPDGTPQSFHAGEVTVATSGNS